MSNYIDILQGNVLSLLKDCKGNDENNVGSTFVVAVKK
jgi:hypothetical protein